VSHASAENITKHWVNTVTLHADPDRVPCWPCHRLHNDPSTCKSNKEDNGAACISDISVERLFQAVKQAWRGTSVVKEFSPVHIYKPNLPFEDQKVRVAQENKIVFEMARGSEHLAEDIVKRLNHG
jgi:hypothetical protein